MAKRKVKELNTCNQFCGAGGCEIGIRRSIVEDLGKIFKGVAINHWDRAVETMRANFPEINTLSCKIEEALPNELIPDGTELHLLWSSPSCVHFSNARGGKPKSIGAELHTEFASYRNVPKDEAERRFRVLQQKIGLNPDEYV